MKMKRFVSTIAAFAMSVSAFAGFTVAQADSNILYERGYETAWTTDDVTEWTVNSIAPDGATELSDYGLHQSGRNIDNAASIAIKPKEGAIIKIDAEWVGMSNTGRTFNQGHASYFRFGNIYVLQSDQEKKWGYTIDAADGEAACKSVTLASADVNAYRDYDISTKNWYVISMEINTTTDTLNYLRISSSADPSTAIVNVENQKLSNPDYSTLAIGYEKTSAVSTTNNEYLKAIRITDKSQKVEYTINYTLDGKILFSDKAIGYVSDIVKAETSLTLNSTKYLAVEGATTSMTLTEGENVLNVPMGKAVDYTINYILNGTTIKTVSDTKAEGSVIEAEKSVSIDNKNYYAADGAATSMTLADGNNVLNVELREANRYTVTVTAVGDIEKTLSTIADVSEGEDATYYFPRYISDGTTLYSTASQNGGYYGTVSNITENKTIKIAYTEVADRKIVYYSEGEDIPGASGRTQYSADKNCSNGKGAYFSWDTEITTLPAGKYKITAAVWGNSGYNFTFTTGENEFIAATTGSHSELTSEEFILTENTPVNVSESRTGTVSLDYVIIEKTGNVGTADTNGNIAVEASDAYTNYISSTNKATGFTAKFTNIGDSMHLVQNLTWIITPENADDVGIPCELGTIMTLRSGASAVVGIVIDGLYDENAQASVKIG